jgi:HD-GYP domain-containing protein (c-di-GMP phosphodiesterase class II)
MAERIKELLEEYGLSGEDADLSLRDLADAYMDQKLLISIGRNLNVERDTEKLLKMILHVSKRITSADAGSIFLIDEGGERLRFKISHTTSVQLDYEEFTMKRDTRSIAGYVSLTGQVLNIPDVYELATDLPYGFNQSFDMLQGYRSKSMLVVPMTNHLGDIIGVIQLLNAKEDLSLRPGEESWAIKLRTREDYETKVIPFKKRYDSLMVAVANQAAIALENSRMIKQIREQFEAFVSASVMAVESRDPATSGHSHRVSQMAVEMAKAVNETARGPYAALNFSPIEIEELGYAGLLHDFGKVYIDPQVFLKAKKLYPRDYDCLLMRLNYLYRSVEIGFERRELAALESGSAEREAIRAERSAILSELLRIVTLVGMLNEPQPTEMDPQAEIERILSTPMPEFALGIDGRSIPLLTEDEAGNLRIKRGSLNDAERKIIESHVEHTWAFVSKIPWPPEFKRIPEYAYAHHEMLDGSGYPRGLTAPDIPVQSRILALCDVFDALLASDRPYKRALPLEKVLVILKEEGSRGKLDADLVDIFVSKQVWTRAQPSAKD